MREISNESFHLLQQGKSQNEYEYWHIRNVDNFFWHLNQLTDLCALWHQWPPPEFIQFGLDMFCEICWFGALLYVWQLTSDAILPRYCQYTDKNFYIYRHKIFCISHTNTDWQIIIFFFHFWLKLSIHWSFDSICFRVWNDQICIPRLWHLYKWLLYNIDKPWLYK